MLKWQKTTTRFLFHTTAPCLSQLVLKFGLHRSTHSCPNFAPKWPTPCWFERRRHSMANCGRMVRDSAKVTMESIIRNYYRSFEWYHLGPYDLPFSQTEGLKCTHPGELRDGCCHLANMIEERCRLLPNYFARCWVGLLFFFYCICTASYAAALLVLWSSNIMQRLWIKQNSFSWCDSGRGLWSTTTWLHGFKTY